MTLPCPTCEAKHMFRPYARTYTHTYICNDITQRYSRWTRSVRTKCVHTHSHTHTMVIICSCIGCCGTLSQNCYKVSWQWTWVGATESHGGNCGRQGKLHSVGTEGKHRKSTMIMGRYRLTMKELLLLIAKSSEGGEGWGVNHLHTSSAKGCLTIAKHAKGSQSH